MNYTQIGLLFQFIGKISIDNKSRFGYQDGHNGRLIGVSICWATSETGTQFTLKINYSCSVINTCRDLYAVLMAEPYRYSILNYLFKKHMVWIRQSKKKIGSQMKKLMLNTRAVFDYLKMTRHSNPLSVL